MGHPKEKFKGLLEDNKIPAQSIPATSKIETHCFAFAHEFLKSKSENFTRTELYFDVDGLVAQYFCSRDGRTYTIKITTSK